MGILTSKAASLLRSYPSVFELHKSDKISKQEYIKLSDKFKTFDDRTKAVENVVKELAKKDAYVSLKGWRNEASEVFYLFIAFFVRCSFL